MTFLGERATNAVEQMDLPGCDPRRLDRTYAQFSVVNRAVAGWRGIYRAQLRPALAAGATTLLDIGCGAGDVPALIGRWAARDGLPLVITGIDPDPRASRFARSRHAGTGITFREATSAELVAEGQHYDLVISNHVLHHLGADELSSLLSDSAALCRGVAVHNDLRRAGLAYALFFAASWVFPGSYIRPDGLTSIRRAYTDAELKAAVPPGWTVSRRPPFRNLLVRDCRAPGAAHG